ncbi:MAG: hypothetical protein IPP19_11995 [Verrucomicrobia bacterium]|nr:hypothetical protein [Verrucomicrobiota bacterium]
MFNRAPSPGRLTLALLCLAGLVGLFLAVRCKQSVSSSATSASTSSKQTAHLNVLNVSDCEWLVVITPSSGGEAHKYKLPLAMSLDLELTAGDYEVEQTMVIANPGPDMTRRFTMHLAAGENYRWRLVTLLSSTSEPKDSHE